MGKRVKKIVITGMGVASPIGFTINKFFDNLCNGVDASSIISSVDVSQFSRKNAVEIKDTLPIKSEWNKYSRATQLALIAACNAILDSGLSIPSKNEYLDMGISIGTMTSGKPELYNSLMRMDIDNDVSSLQYDFDQYPNQAIANAMTSEFNITGRSNTIGVACASGTISIGSAYKWIKNGRMDKVICGGVDSFNFLDHVSMSSLRVISPNKVKPFDDKRKGYLMGEGAGMLILESEESAIKRGATIYGEIVGYGETFDAADLSHPNTDGAGLSKAMKIAMNEASISPSEVDYINAHGTATKMNDAAEMASINNVFQSNEKRPYVSSIKGSIGHLVAASGAVEAISVVCSINAGKIPPTLNSEISENNRKTNIVFKNFKTDKVDIAISNSIAMGGNNVSIIFRRY